MENQKWGWIPDNLKFLSQIDRYIMVCNYCYSTNTQQMTPNSLNDRITSYECSDCDKKFQTSLKQLRESEFEAFKCWSKNCYTQLKEFDPNQILTDE